MVTNVQMQEAQCHNPRTRSFSLPHITAGPPPPPPPPPNALMRGNPDNLSWNRLSDASNPPRRRTLSPVPQGRIAVPRVRSGSGEQIGADGGPQSYTRRAPLIPPQRPEDKGKLVVVLDLDETLVDAHLGNIAVRPGVEQLLLTLRGRCEVIVWTASVRDRAVEIIRHIDRRGVIQHCVHRHYSWWTEEYGCAKDLRLLGRPMGRVILVDNTPEVFRKNPQNSLLVPDFDTLRIRATGRPDRALYSVTDFFDKALRARNADVNALFKSPLVVPRPVKLVTGGVLYLNVLANAEYSSPPSARWTAAVGHPNGALFPI